MLRRLTFTVTGGLDQDQDQLVRLVFFDVFLKFRSFVDVLEGCTKLFESPH